MSSALSTFAEAHAVAFPCQEFISWQVIFGRTVLELIDAP